MKSRRARRKLRGFTLIEVMLAVAVMLVGVLGIIQLQRSVFRANADARTTATATANTERWVGVLRRSALRWTDSATVAGVPYLEDVGSGWVIPASDTAEPYGMDWYGVPTTTAADIRYCTLIKLTWLTQDAAMRAEVITFWPKERVLGSGGEAFGTLCDPTDGSTAAGAVNADSPETTLAGTNLRVVRASVVLRRAQP